MSNTKGGIVIFLDVDGVLLPVSPMQMGGGDLDDSCLDRFKDVVQHCATMPTVILSSTWRNDPEKIKRLQAAFDAIGRMPQIAGGVPNGVPNPTEVTYLPKDLDERKLVRDRVDEIYAWIEANKDIYPFASTRWLAIDDMDLGVDARMRGHFVHTSIEDGMSRDDTAKAIKLIDSFPEAPPAAPVAATAAAVAVASTGDAPAAAPTLPEGVALDGVVKRYNASRGFGFITTIKDEVPVDIFVHQSGITMDGFRGLNVGAGVSFKVGIISGRQQAVEVAQKVPYVPHLNGANINNVTKSRKRNAPRAAEPVRNGEESAGNDGQTAPSAANTVETTATSAAAPKSDAESATANRMKLNRKQRGARKGADGGSEGTEQPAAQSAAATAVQPTESSATEETDQNATSAPAAANPSGRSKRRRNLNRAYNGFANSVANGIANGFASSLAGGPISAAGLAFGRPFDPFLMFTPFSPFGVHPQPPMRPSRESGLPSTPPPWMIPMYPDGSGWRAANGTVFYAIPEGAPAVPSSPPPSASTPAPPPAASGESSASQPPPTAPSGSVAGKQKTSAPASAKKGRGRQ